MSGRDMLWGAAAASGIAGTIWLFVAGLGAIATATGGAPLF